MVNPIKPPPIKEAPFLGGEDSSDGAGVEFSSGGGDGDSSPEGAGEGGSTSSDDGDGGEADESCFLVVLSAITTTRSFWFFRQ